MASPPSYHNYNPSPPPPSNLALPRQRPTGPQLALPTINHNQNPTRKHSNASYVSSASNPTSAHPLRQTSFPPPDSFTQHQQDIGFAARQYSPSAADSLDDFSDGDNDIQSAISGPTAASDAGTTGLKKRKRGEKRPRGRPAKNPRASSVDDAGARPSKKGEQAADEDAANASDASGSDHDAPGSTRVPLYEGGQLTLEQQASERERKRVFYETVSEPHRARLAAFQRGKLRTADVRKLVNQVLGQSVPQNVVLVVSAYAKMFAGGLVEEARGVLGEWVGVDEDVERNRALERARAGKRVKREHIANGTGPDESHATDFASQSTSKPTTSLETSEATSASTTQPTTQPTTTTNPLQPGAGALSSSIQESDLGPLLPSHLREALRRHKRRHAGGAVGFTGLSLEGRENGASRIGGGGRRLFR